MRSPRVLDAQGIEFTVSVPFERFAELKSDCQIGYIPVTTRVGNQLYLLAGLLAHNLNRELRMRVHPRSRPTTAKRTALCLFQEVKTLRGNLLQRAGRIICPQGKTVLSMNANAPIQNELLHYLEALDQYSVFILSFL